MQRKQLVAFAAWVSIQAAGCGDVTAPVAMEPALVIPERAGVYTEATRHYGPLIVRETRDPGGDFAAAKTRPWSSHWYPFKDDFLVKGGKRNGGLSTLEKYDQYSRKVFGFASTAVLEEERKGLYNPLADNWEGRCGAWAIASVLEPEPALPASGVKVPGTDLTFYTRDVKALVIKSYERIENEAFMRFGQPYGLDDSDGARQIEDIYPDQFHRVLQAELFEKHRPIVMDDTATLEVWNTPIWQALIRITRDRADQRVMHVVTHVKGTQSINIPADYSSFDPVTPSTPRFTNTTYEYTYDLYGEPQADGSLLVKYGKWTGDSVQHHPDYVIALPDEGVQVAHSSFNGQVDPKVIQDILTKTGAFDRRGAR